MGKLDGKETFTIGGLIADAARNSRTKQRIDSARDKVGGAVDGARHQASKPRGDRKARAIRDEAAGWESAPGGSTPSRARLSSKDKRAADKILREGKSRKR